MKVRWTIFANNSVKKAILARFPEENLPDFDKHYEGDVIGASEEFIGNNLLYIFEVACTDGIVRSCDIMNAEVIKEEQK